MILNTIVFGTALFLILINIISKMRRGLMAHVSSQSFKMTA